jgi:prevent-host-death family protein
MMAKSVPAREARARFAEITNQVRYTGEPVIVEKQGKPFVAVVTLDDMDELERFRALRRQAEFTRLAMRAAREAGEPEKSEDEIVKEMKEIRRAIYRERYERT